ncbi:MAG: SpoIIE family protein phosphatase [Phycisphaeraceae bacterium]
MPRLPRPLTDLVEATILQRIVRHFTAVTGHAVSIRDTGGDVLAEADTQPASCDEVDDGDSASITVNHRCLAVMRLGRQLSDTEHQALGEADGAGVAATMTGGNGGPATSVGISREQAASFMGLLADTIAQMCQQGQLLKSRVDDLSTLFELSTLLSGKREMRTVLDTTARSVVELMSVKAASIRLLDASDSELLTEAVHNLSPEYLNKGKILVKGSELDQLALRGEVVYIEDMTEDSRVMYPEDAKREGLASMLCAGMIYRGKPIGVIRIYTAQRQAFSEDRKNLLRAIAQIAAASIRTAQLDAERREQTRIQRQVQLAADVQRKLLPASDPDCAPFEVAGRYEPCFELGGDFYDFIPLESSLGVVIGDVVGKGVAAGLLMASVRASLRAHVEDVYDLDDVMGRVNAALVHDTRDHEFATVFYGTLDRRSLRLTYCSAGHDPSLLLRDGKFKELSVGGMALGIDAGQKYVKGMVDLRPKDVIVLYSDGVPDASNFEGEKFGRQRLREAILEMADHPPRDVVNHILWQVRRFVGLNYRPDDMTIVAVRVNVPRG